MWVYKMRFYSQDDHEWRNAEGLVAGETIADSYNFLADYYGDGIEDLRISALESGTNVLDFENCDSPVTYNSFFSEIIG